MAEPKIMNSETPFQQQLPFCDQPSPAEQWDEQVAKRALDELFHATLKYRTSQAFHDLICFVRKFRFYSPYNAFLVHIQRPGARFVATASKWEKEYRRALKPNANPLVILQPRGPVMFVFDVADTEEGPNSFPLPPEVEHPFEVKSGRIGYEFEKTIENAIRDGIRISSQVSGSQAAGKIEWIFNHNLPPLEFSAGRDKNGNEKIVKVPVKFELIINSNLSKEAKYATIAHELAHLYCGHLGTPNKKWWPDRRGMKNNEEEFEAEAASYLVCGRLGIDSPSEAYLHNYLDDNAEVPKISLEQVMKAAGLIESMGQKPLKPRKDE
jgi:hypothetical protein